MGFWSAGRVKNLLSDALRSSCKVIFERIKMKGFCILFAELDVCLFFVVCLVGWFLRVFGRCSDNPLGLVKKKHFTLFHKVVFSAHVACYLAH